MEFGSDPEIKNKAGKSSLDFAKTKNVEELINIINKKV
jgi:hypothetical protein